MSKKQKARVLFVSQEITPYLPETPMGSIGRKLPQGIQERGKEIRAFMPKYGCINERRNQLHEVIRLSGMNLIIDDNDHQLIIKVASLPSARMQVYFIDNQEYFERKHVLTDKKGKHFKDNDERSIFFCRGVIETVNKLGWSPDVVHLHGWASALTALYLKKSFADNPIFADTKIVYSVYDEEFPDELDKNFAKKVLHDGIDAKDVNILKKPTFVNLNKLAIDIADGIIIGSETINKDLTKHIKKANKPTLDFVGAEEYIDAYSEFYDSILEEVAELV